MQFELANPSPGAFVQPGGLVVEGIALDTRAEEGIGIDRVDFFLDSRDAGGTTLGTAVPSSLPEIFGPGGFQTTIQLPNQSGAHDIVAYAHSTITGQTTVIAVPVAVGKDPVVAGVTSANGSTPSIVESCSGVPQPMDATEPSAPAVTPSMSVPQPAIPNVAISPSDTSVMLEIANPAAGDAILSGAYAMEGIAYDAAADEGLGIDRIDIFLDSRDEGGSRLGSAILGSPNPRAPDGGQFGDAGWHTIIDFPTKSIGAHTLFVYAHSAITDAETVATIPITVTR